MTEIVIITAMQSEFNAMCKLYDFSGDDKFAVAAVNGHQIVLIKSGIGKVNAAVMTEYSSNLKPDYIITTGLAGGIDQSLHQGDIILADKACYHDVWCGSPNQKGQVQDLPPYYAANDEAIKKIKEKAPDFNVGLILTGDQFITDEKKLYQIKQDFPQALAVDMESAAVAQVCYLNQIPFLSLRIISDVVGKKEQQQQYEDFWKNMPSNASKMLEIALSALLSG
ncbi:MAG: 5'-methylthioadenosine/adenosylhomocysteine nucleosidase [Alphaproteobacteria bacterium]|nr:5'-methylthioadenosine/adenosylhomocysteine nucleosidase [Alphaproteobacteria bacterium]